MKTGSFVRYPEGGLIPLGSLQVRELMGSADDLVV